MKQIYLLFLILFSKSIIQAQPVFPTYEEEPVWCVQESVFGMPPQTYLFKMGKDTTICNKIYTRILWCPNSQSNEAECGIWTHIRQEEGRIYRYSESCRETLIYDFTLQQGDTIRHGLDDSYGLGVVSKVDTINYNGVLRKTLTIDYPQLFPFPMLPIKRTWIEGIGDIFHPFDHVLCLSSNCEFTSSVICFSNKNGIQYGACTEPCNIDNTTDTDDVIKNKFIMHLSRNPVRVQERLNVYLDSTKPATGQLYIVNIFGQILYHKNLQLAGYEERMELDWAPAAAGIYWLVWQSKDGSRQSLKLVVQ